jgi:hypothetical protein
MHIWTWSLKKTTRLAAIIESKECSPLTKGWFLHFVTADNLQFLTSVTISEFSEVTKCSPDFGTWSNVCNTKQIMLTCLWLAVTAVNVWSERCRLGGNDVCSGRNVGSWKWRLAQRELSVVTAGLKDGQVFTFLSVTSHIKHFQNSVSITSIS